MKRWEYRSSVSVSSIGRVQTARGFRYFPKAAHVGGYARFKGILVHRLVHIMFNDPELKLFRSGDSVDHKDRNRLNNRKDNLCWASSSSQRANQIARKKGGSSCVRVSLTCVASGVTTVHDSLQAAARSSGLSTGTLSTCTHSKGFVIDRIQDDDLPSERWKHVDGAKVSSLGRFQPSNSKNRFFPKACDSGYCRVMINGKQVLMHRVVMDLFGSPSPSVVHTIHHKDRDRTNNAISNLEWATPSEQANDRAVPVTSHARRIEGRYKGDPEWTQLSDVHEAAARFSILRSSDVTGVCNPNNKAKTVANGAGKRVEFRYADDDQCDLPGEEWMPIVPSAWIEGGIYCGV